MPIRPNNLDQNLDIAGSFNQNQNMTETEEPFKLGTSTGQSGTTASIFNFSSNISTITNLSGMTTSSPGRYLTISGTDSPDNSGTFLITKFNAADSVDISNPLGSAPDLNNNSLLWIERNPYTLEDDINYIRTDRKLIKGTINWYNAVPTYTRPNSSTSVPANLKNISGKTTDAVAYNVNKSFYGQSVAPGNASIRINSTGNLKQATFSDQTGIPTFDGGPFLNDWQSCYVHIVDGSNDGYSGSELTVIAGSHSGERIFGLTFAGASTSPNSVDVKFYSTPFHLNYTTNSTPYTWESALTNSINLLYSYSQRLDQLDVNALRTVPALGILTDHSIGGSGGGGGSGPSDGMTPIEHETLRQLIHLADGVGGPMEGLLANSAYREVLPQANPFPTNVNWWTSAAKVAKFVDKSIAYNDNKNPITIQWRVYGTDGVTILATVTDSISYSGLYETTRTRNIVDNYVSFGNLTEETHKYVRQLIHLADGVGGPYEGFSSGTTRESLPFGSILPTSVIWYNDNLKDKKIVEKLIQYNANNTISLVTWKVYDIDGLTVLSTVSDNISYSGVFETERTRSII